MIVAKLRGARERMKKRDGRCESRKPHGTSEGEAQTLARMKDLKASGLSFDRIAATLNQAGVKSRTQREWKSYVVNRILTRAA